MVPIPRLAAPHPPSAPVAPACPLVRAALARHTVAAVRHTALRAVPMAALLAAVEPHPPDLHTAVVVAVAHRGAQVAVDPEVRVAMVAATAMVAEVMMGTLTGVS